MQNENNGSHFSNGRQVCKNYFNLQIYNLSLHFINLNDWNILPIKLPYPIILLERLYLDEVKSAFRANVNSLLEQKLKFSHKQLGSTLTFLRLNYRPFSVTNVNSINARHISDIFQLLH